MNAPLPHHVTQHLLPKIAQRETPAAFIDALKARFNDRCSTALIVREQHGKDESSFASPPPSAVVFAESTQDVADAVKLASLHNVPVIPFGVGTVQPGVTRKQLNEEVKSTGLFFPIDPGADATLGGMSATRASGTNAVRYGTMRENVLALEVVTAQGDVIRTGTRAKKSSAGYDLTRLMVGSEGTLGVITEVTVKLYPLPEAISAAVCSFPSIEAAVRTTIEVIQMGVPIARVELLDGNTVSMVNAHSKTTLPESPMLLMEFHGSPTGVKEQAELVQEIASSHGSDTFEWASTPEERSRLWAARHNAYFAAIQSRPGCKAISTDTCVPISRLADCLLDSIAEVDATNIPYFLVGHVGDGNFHFGYLIDPNSPEERRIAEELNHKLVSRALDLEGTCTGEHGVGLHKMDFLITEAGDGAVEMMRTIKRALDPKNIMNPGKIFTI